MILIFSFLEFIKSRGILFPATKSNTNLSKDLVDNPGRQSHALEMAPGEVEGLRDCGISPGWVSEEFIEQEVGEQKDIKAKRGCCRSIDQVNESTIRNEQAKSQAAYGTGNGNRQRAIHRQQAREINITSAVESASSPCAAVAIVKAAQLTPNRGAIFSESFMCDSVLQPKFEAVVTLAKRIPIYQRLIRESVSVNNNSLHGCGQRLFFLTLPSTNLNESLVNLQLSHDFFCSCEKVAHEKTCPFFGCK